jgi:TM2 domain-containing membrane protein YozV
MKKLISGILILLLFCCIPLSAFSEERNYERKDPILAGALSYYVPGLGQFYAGSYVKGAAFWVVEQTLLISTLLTIAEVELSVAGDVSLGLNIKSKDETSKKQRKTAIILGSTLVVVHFINIIDAVNSTRNYNLQRAEGIFADFRYDEEKRTYNVELKTRF